MRIRHYHPGDEDAQARIYNTAAGALPAFKPAKAEEIARRYRSADSDPSSKFYAEEDGRIVGYAVFNPNGRVSYPWCLPEAQAAREPLLGAVLKGLNDRGVPEAWAAYRADWTPVQSFLREHGFHLAREMVNFIAELGRLPRAKVPPGQIIEPLEPGALPEVVALGREIFPDDRSEPLEHFFWENKFLDPNGLFALKRGGKIVGMGLVVINGAYADPTKIDAAMPCFRLGALGTERERHKRVNGLVSCVFEDEATGEVLLAEAVRRLERAGLTHAAAQAPSDAHAVVSFYERFFRRQGAFPILSRRLA